MSSVRVLVGTKKGAFVLSSDGQRILAKHGFAAPTLTP